MREGRGDVSTRRRDFAASAKNPAVRRIQLGFAGACTAEWAFTVVLSVYAYEQGGAKAVGLVSLLRMLPAAVLAPFASARAAAGRVGPRCSPLVAAHDARRGRRDRRPGGDGRARGGRLRPRVASTVAAILYRPVNSALLPLLCHTPSELGSANVVRGLLDSVSTLVGPAIAGGLLAVADLTAGFTAVAVLAGLAAVVTFGLTVEQPEGQVSRSSVARGLVRGAEVTFRSPQLRVMFVLLAAQTLTRGALSVFRVLVAVDLLGMGEPGVGTLTAAVGAGAVLGSLFALMYVGNGASPRGSAPGWPRGFP